MAAANGTVRPARIVESKDPAKPCVLQVTDGQIDRLRPAPGRPAGRACRHGCRLFGYRGWELPGDLGDWPCSSSVTIRLPRMFNAAQCAGLSGAGAGLGLPAGLSFALRQHALNPVEQGAVMIGLGDPWALFAKIARLLRRAHYISGENYVYGRVSLLHPPG